MNKQLPNDGVCLSSVEFSKLKKGQYVQSLMTNRYGIILKLEEKWQTNKKRIMKLLSSGLNHLKQHADFLFTCIVILQKLFCCQKTLTLLI
jgi:hypothetical protein